MSLFFYFSEVTMIGTRIELKRIQMLLSEECLQTNKLLMKQLFSFRPFLNF